MPRPLEESEPGFAAQGPEKKAVCANCGKAMAAFHECVPVKDPEQYRAMLEQAAANLDIGSDKAVGPSFSEVPVWPAEPPEVEYFDTKPTGVKPPEEPCG